MNKKTQLCRTVCAEREREGARKTSSLANLRGPKREPCGVQLGANLQPGTMAGREGHRLVAGRGCTASPRALWVCCHFWLPFLGFARGFARLSACGILWHISAWHFCHCPRGLGEGSRSRSVRAQRVHSSMCAQLSAWRTGDRGLKGAHGRSKEVAAKEFFAL